MRTALLTTVLAVSLLVNSNCALRSYHRDSLYLTNSVQALQRPGDVSKGERAIATFCTTFSINETEGIWATAQHCVRGAEQRGWGMTIHGVAVITIFHAPENDLALVQGDVHAPALPLATQAPAVGDRIEIRGFPYGMGYVVTWGKVAARNIPLQHEPLGLIYNDILDVTGAPGNSGSPVLKDGYVVGVLWGGFETPHSIGVPWEVVKRALGAYWA